MKTNEEQFTNISDEEEQQIHFIESKQPFKPLPKRKKEQSVFTSNQMMQHIQITLVGFEKETFLKIQTQTYKIQVRNLRTDQLWIIKRRHSDVVWLHDALRINHLGYICPFLPSSTFESFLTAKLGFSFGKDKKDEFINERTELISNFLRAVYSHSDLKFSQEAQIFVNRNDNDFMTQRKRMQSYMEEYKELETASTSFLSIVQKGSSLISNYLGGSKKLARQISKEDLEFEGLGSKVIEKENILKRLSEGLSSLITLKAEESQSIQIEGDWDKIETLNTKLEEGRKHNANVSNCLRDKILRNVNQLVCWTQQVHSQLSHRKQLVEFVYSLKQNIDDISRIKKLQRRIQKFQNNFRMSYQSFKKCLSEEQGQILKVFSQVWGEYKQSMNKIWG